MYEFPFNLISSSKLVHFKVKPSRIYVCMFINYLLYGDELLILRYICIPHHHHTGPRLRPQTRPWNKPMIKNNKNRGFMHSIIIRI